MIRKGIQSSFALGQKMTTVLVCLLVNSGLESSLSVVRKGIQSSFALGQKSTTVLVCLLVNSGFESSFLCGRKGNSVLVCIGSEKDQCTCLSGREKWTGVFVSRWSEREPKDI